jgi:hypothetical protein
VKKISLFLVVLFLLAACAPANPAPMEPAVTPDTGSEGNLDQAYIQFEISGGITGKAEKWTIYPDGRIVSPGGENTFPRAEFAPLLSDLETLGFFQLEDQYRSANSCNDCFQYTITVHNGVKLKTVSGVDAGGNLPSSFWDVFNRINSFVQSR